MEMGPVMGGQDYLLPFTNEGQCLDTDRYV